MAAAAAQLSDMGAGGVYFTPNPLKGTVTSSITNQASPASRGALAKDIDVLSPRWLLIDIDPERPKDCAATDEEKAQRARLLRLEQLAAKNPETAAWKKYQRRADPIEGGKQEYVVEKVLKTERHREARASTRAQRRAERKEDNSLHAAARTNDNVELI